MDRSLIEKIKNDPDFQKLVSERNRVMVILTALELIIYFGFILLVAFNKEFLAQKIGEGVVTIGIPIGIGVIVLSFLLTGVYVYIANKDYDELSEKIKKKYLKEV
ncbi:DUF485 domain-containing protein [Sulfurihydrogenibium azorense]|uniref:Membrane protein n=1 Tax=Sulfurihydrogenibium azorense (strain DSM 15241 / OCM 825 / Az-Fu1) TaxID=204536 RepID=C1DWC2_SULAA|nr:DUF485 domain-containing protein [Sulfurihydrogenibium azorense]ACN99493.1 membrane protein [Sulfurihydrogenibium azorense Az-Fu1]MDM7274299.1 DUF485 domain-containing protein [Sulfurihydrogenibium azorense]